MAGTATQGSSRAIATSPISRILLLRLRLIGDVVFTTPAVRALRRRFPDAHLAYLVEPAAAPVVALNPHLDEVIVAPRAGGPGQLLADVALGRRLHAARYDLAIDFHGGPRSSLLAWLSRARVRIGYRVTGRAWMYTHRVARPRALRPRHSVENQWDLLAPLAIAPPTRASDPVEMPPDPDAVRSVATRLAGAGFGVGDRLVIDHDSAGNPFRRWPQTHFVVLARGLAADDERRRVIVTSGPSEAEAARAGIERARAGLEAGVRDRIVSCGEFSIAELRALADRAALFIGGDSGPLHVAATSRVPIVGLYGPTLPVRSDPWRDPACLAESLGVETLPCRPCDQRRCDPGDFRCLTWIAPEQVMEAAERLLSAKIV
ncbi:MAG: glycosyltransferase family 9 protein [Betaproteobacteria bacterium]